MLHGLRGCSAPFAVHRRPIPVAARTSNPTPQPGRNNPCCHAACCSTHTGRLLQGLNEDCSTIQLGVGDKLGMTIYNLAAAVTGMAIGEGAGSLDWLRGTRCAHGTLPEAPAWV